MWEGCWKQLSQKNQTLQQDEADMITQNLETKK